MSGVEGKLSQPRFRKQDFKFRLLSSTRQQPHYTFTNAAFFSQSTLICHEKELFPTTFFKPDEFENTGLAFLFRVNGKHCEN